MFAFLLLPRFPGKGFRVGNGGLKLRRTKSLFQSPPQPFASSLGLDAGRLYVVIHLSSNQRAALCSYQQPFITHVRTNVPQVSSYALRKMYAAVFCQLVSVASREASIHNVHRIRDDELMVPGIHERRLGR